MSDFADYDPFDIDGGLETLPAVNLQNCVVCGALQEIPWNKKTCSPECANRHSDRMAVEGTSARRLSQKKCLACGVKYTPDAGNQKYCKNKKCQDNRKSSKYRAAVPIALTSSLVNCECCGTPFKPKSRQHRFCHRAACEKKRQRNYYLKSEQRKIAKRDPNTPQFNRYE